MDDNNDIYIDFINGVICGEKMEDYEENVASKTLIMLTIEILKPRLKQGVLTMEIY